MSPKNAQVLQEPQPGLFLIADPFLADPGFSKSIIFLVSHDHSGSVGFILNQPGVLKVGHVIDGFPEEKTVMHGGPVALDQVFFIHTCPRVTGSYHIRENLHWAGAPDALRSAVDYGLLSMNEILFFNGYSGWGPGQLVQELEDKSWILANLDTKCLFDKPEGLWKNSLRALGGHYAWLSEAPEHPQLN